ncbi:type II secretion system protein GspL [Enterobacter ludwigii]|uniref:type II secretion system protein GspL n=1 Tax=Enterobacter ludwigii TaxID=299767 RepID=UPI001E4968D5|nr:type II secretion system protein GspL [Enterobacter ludwigii]MCE1613396.1 type II secretion system protein GspL [Enterobacter ludwigii]MCE1626697.1 type II secretion system protein GspL [Enterobacter ludwigii]
MKSQDSLLLISLDDSQESMLWCWGDPTQAFYTKSGECYSAEDFPEELVNSPTVVLLPSLNIVLRNVECPGNPRSVNAEALAYQCEETLLEEVDDLHWVILRREGSCYLIAGYRHADMTRWLEKLPCTRQQIIAVLPDIVAFPWKGEPAEYRLRGKRLFSSAPGFGYSLPLSWQEEKTSDDIELVSGTDADSLWLCAATTFSPASTLLKGDFAPRPYWLCVDFWNRWLPIAAYSLLLCTFLLATINEKMAIMHREQQISTIYTQLFSDEKLPQQSEKFIANLVKNIKAQAGEAHFFSLGEQLLETLPENNQYTLTALQFDKEQARLVATVKSGVLTPAEYSNSYDNKILVSPSPGGSPLLFTIEIREPE